MLVLFQTFKSNPEPFPGFFQHVLDISLLDEVKFANAYSLMYSWYFLNAEDFIFVYLFFSLFLSKKEWWYYVFLSTALAVWWVQNKSLYNKMYRRKIFDFQCLGNGCNSRTSPAISLLANVVMFIASKYCGPHFPLLCFALTMVVFGH
jgi:hypothetical protein